jgi:hypothetical protein
MLERDLIEKLQESLPRLLPLDGLKFRFLQGAPADHANPFDLLVGVSNRDLGFRMVIEVAASGSLPDLPKKIGRLKAAAAGMDQAVPVLVAPYLSPERQEICRKEGIGFIDLSGNAYLKFGALYIERIGFPNRYPVKRQGRSPFSDKASLILRALLKERDRLWGIREMAQEIGLDPGFVSRMAKEIEGRGYAARVSSKLRLRSLDGILDDWVRSYSLKKNRLSGYFCMAANVEDVLDRLRRLEIPGRVRYALSVQAGASLVAPFASFKEVHLYAMGAEEVEFFEKGLNLNPAERGANLILMKPHYRDSVLFGSRIVAGLRVVSDIQLYLDLHGYPLRGLEQAEHLLRRRIKPELGDLDDHE